MKEGRKYRQACHIAYAMDVIGERWTLLLIRELLIGPKRFNQLQDGLTGIGTNLLAARLKELEEGGVVEKIDDPEGSKRKLYELTSLGAKLEGLLREIIRWGVQLPDSVKSEDDRGKEEWDLLALRLLFRPEQAQGAEGIVGVRSEDSELYLRVDDSGLREVTIPEDSPTVIIEGERSALVRLFQGRDSLNQLLKEKMVKLRGDEKFARKWASGFACR